MNSIQFRKSPVSSIIVAALFLLLWLSGLLWSVSALMNPAESGANPPQSIIVGIYVFYVLAFLLPVLVFGIKSIHNYRIRYVLTEAELRCYEGSELIQQIPKDEISSFGCYGANKNVVLFFVMATEAEIAAVAKQDWDARNWLYTPAQLKELERTPEGIWQIEVALYIQHTRNTNTDTLLTMEYTAERLQSVAELWKMAPMHLGSQAYAHRNSPF